MFVLAPFAGFAPLLLVILISGIYWFFSPFIRILILGDIERDGFEPAKNKVRWNKIKSQKSDVVNS